MVKDILSSALLYKGFSVLSDTLTQLNVPSIGAQQFDYALNYLMVQNHS